MVSMNKTDFARPLAWSIATLSVTLTVASIVISLVAMVQSDSRQWLPLHLWFSPPSTVTFALVGALVASRQPRNPIGWICSTVAVLTGLTLFTFSYRTAGKWGSVALPGMDFARWLDLWVWIPATILPLTFILLLFPDGRLPSPRWRPIGWAAGVGLSAYILSVALHPWPLVEPNSAPNPFGISGAGNALDLLGVVANILVTVGAVGSMAALVIRFRRSRGIEREQLKWLAYAGALAVLGNIVIYGWYAARPNDLLSFDLMLIGITAALTAIALAAGIAILRHRLYDINLVINRTLVYGALTAAIAGIYLLVVGGLGVLLQASGSVALSLLGVGMVAMVVQPVRDRLQRAVNRLMYGERDDPYAVLSRLRQRLEATLAPEAVLPAIVETVAQALKLPRAAIALKEENGFKIVAVSPVQPLASASPIQDTGDAGEVLPLIYQGEIVGQFIFSPRAPGETFTVAERRLLEDIAHQAGVAVHAVRLTADLQHSRERLVTAREEERRRLRRDLHDGLGPHLASQSFKLEAARDSVRNNPDKAEALLNDLIGKTQNTIGDIRRLVYALRPPALDELGLIAAVREHAAQCELNGVRITVVAPDHLPSLPAAVEVATYRIVQEALTNVVRHAQAQMCTISIELKNGALSLQISDDGIGMSRDHHRGVGLSSMRERAEELGGQCVIEPTLDGGTRVKAELPFNV